MPISDPQILKRAQYLNESILLPVQNFFEAALKVLPRTSKIIAKPDVCKDVVKIPDHASESGYDSDLVIFVKILDENAYGDDYVFAEGAACGLDEATNRFENIIWLILTLQ